MVVYANIGSNLGNSKQLIEAALEKISESFGICCRSSYIESDPWGYESDHRFLNLGVSFCSSLHPEQILDKLQTIEKSICEDSHRDKDGNYVDRQIDIDIMAIDDLHYSSSRLQIPHKHLEQRDFFLIPLKELKVK